MHYVRQAWIEQLQLTLKLLGWLASHNSFTARSSSIDTGKARCIAANTNAQKMVWAIVQLTIPTKCRRREATQRTIRTQRRRHTLDSLRLSNPVAHRLNIMVVVLDSRGMRCIWVRAGSRMCGKKTMFGCKMCTIQRNGILRLQDPQCGETTTNPACTTR